MSMQLEYDPNALRLTPPPEGIHGLPRRVWDSVVNNSPNSVSQEDFFRLLVNEIQAAQNQILVYGFDPAFFYEPQTIDALTDAIEGKGDGRKYPVKVYATIPSQFPYPLLDTFVENKRVEVTRTPFHPRTGYIVFDDNAYARWNLNKPTRHLPEKYLGVPFRELFPRENEPSMFAAQIAKGYFLMRERLQNHD